MENVKLYEALINAQSEIDFAKLNKVNPHFKNKYADLASIMDACKVALINNELCILQIITTDDKGQMFLVTRLAHISGEFIESKFALRSEKNTIQGLGSTITYARRYSLSSMLGIVADEDDDCEIAMKEQEALITPVQAQELAKKLASLRNGDRADVIKAIGTSNIKDIKASKYDSVCKYVDSVIKRTNGA